MKPQSPSKIVLTEIGRMILGLVLLTLGLGIAIGLFSGSLWSLIFLGPIYLLIVIGYLDSMIHGTYELLVRNRKEFIKEQYPHVSVNVNGQDIKNYKEFLRIPDTEWASREEKALQYEEEQRRREEQIETDYLELESIAPHGIEKWLKKNDLKADWREENRDDYKKYINELISSPISSGIARRPQWVDKRTIIKYRKEIIQFEDLYQRWQRDTSWFSTQKQFSKEIVTLCKEKFSFLGRYVCPVPVKLVDDEGKEVAKTTNVWQLFFNSYCTEDGWDYTYYPQQKELGDYFSGQPYPKDWAPPFNLGFLGSVISEIDRTLSARDVTLIIYEEDALDRLMDNYFDSIIDKEAESATLTPVEKYVISSLYLLDLPRYKYEDLVSGKDAHNNILIITALLKTEDIIDIAKRIWERLPEARPNICFLSLFKDYSREEMQSLIDKKKKSIAEEEEKKRKEQVLLDSIPSKVEGWETLSMSGGLKIDYLLDYYPTKVEFEADDDEWDDRWIVWSFKNDPQKTSGKAHQRALERVIPEFADLLKNTFSDEALKYLSLVCIPASTPEKNEARYKEFSERLCQETGMENGFEHIHVTSTREAKHEGGKDENVNYYVDDSFFNGKRVILLDDVITKGNSMRIAKAILQKKGAKVICGLAVGKTRHERRASKSEEE